MAGVGEIITSYIAWAVRKQRTQGELETDCKPCPMAGISQLDSTSNMFTTPQNSASSRGPSAQAHKPEGRSYSNQNTVCHIWKDHKSECTSHLRLLRQRTTAWTDHGPDSFKQLLFTISEAPSPWFRCSQCWFLLVLPFLTRDCNLLPVSYMVCTYVSYYPFLRKTANFFSVPELPPVQSYLQRHGGEDSAAI